MAKKNYAAWYIDSAKFSEDWNEVEKLKFFAKYAILAPSGHNSQPWQLTARRGYLEVTINKSRYLSVDGSGLLSVEPYISIGTFLETFNLAARGFGYAVQIKLSPATETMAKISIRGKVAAESSLLQAISDRVSNRHFFEKNPIGSTLLKEITSNGFPGIEISVITDRADIDFIAIQTETAIKSIMGNPAYREELSAWVRANHSRRYEGMPGFTHGFGNLKSLLSKVAVRKGAKLGPQAKKSKGLIEGSAALVIVRCKDNKKVSFVNAGRTYSQICILANKHNLASSALGASVLDPITRENVKKKFNIDDRPIYIIRLGRAKVKARHSPRWPIEAVLVK